MADFISFQPKDYFKTVLYTGNGSTQSITGVGFSPGLCWIKDRGSSAYDHQLYDPARGVTKAVATVLKKQGAAIAKKQIIKTGAGGMAAAAAPKIGAVLAGSGILSTLGIGLGAAGTAIGNVGVGNAAGYAIGAGQYNTIVGNQAGTET